jgi:hypothetical protein
MTTTTKTTTKPAPAPYLVSLVRDHDRIVGGACRCDYCNRIRPQLAAQR